MALRSAAAALFVVGMACDQSIHFGDLPLVKSNVAGRRIDLSGYGGPSFVSLFSDFSLSSSTCIRPRSSSTMPSVCR